MAETQRLFFALWPEATLQRTIYDHLQSHITGHGRAVPADNLHITLAFLGSSSAEQRACYEQVATAITSAPFELPLHHIGHWPKPRVLWLGPDVTPVTLSALVEQLNAGLTACGYSPETRPYQPHMTVARKFAGTWSRKTIEPIPWTIDQFVLAESVTDPAGARYRVLRSWPLRPSIS